MKTNLMKLVKVVALAAMTMMLANCSKDNGSSSNGYSFNAYGQCVQTSTGQIATNSSYCTTSNNGYSYNSYGQCVYTATGQIAPSTSYCTTSAYGSNICNGTFYYNQGYGVQSIQCSSSSTNYYTSSYQSGYSQVYNCRGLYLSPTTTLQSFVTCQ